MKIHDALENTLSLLRKINRYLEEKAPWKSIKEDDSQGGSAATTLALSADILRIGSQLLNPVMPEKTKTILNILGSNPLPFSAIYTISEGHRDYFSIKEITKQIEYLHLVDAAVYEKDAIIKFDKLKYLKKHTIDNL